MTTTPTFTIAAGQRYMILEMPGYYVVVERVTRTRVYYAMQEEGGTLFRSEYFWYIGTQAFEGMVLSGSYLLVN